MKIIISGAYAIGTHLAKLLSRNNQDTVLIDDDEERLLNVSSDYDLLTINDDPSSISTMEEAGVKNADLYIAVTPDQSLNLNTCIMAKAMGAKRTVAKVDNYEYIDPKLDGFFERIGITSLIYPENLAAKEIANGLKMSWVRQRWDVHDGALVMLGIKLRETCEILNEPLKDLCKPESPYHIVAIKRGDETIIPRGDDELKIYDLAYFMTTRNYIPYIRKIVGKGTLCGREERDDDGRRRNGGEGRGHDARVHGLQNPGDGRATLPEAERPGGYRPRDGDQRRRPRHAAADGGRREEHAGLRGPDG